MGNGDQDTAGELVEGWFGGGLSVGEEIACLFGEVSGGSVGLGIDGINPQNPHSNFGVLAKEPVPVLGG
ncbi:PREDICTED: LOC18785058 isoform [Prunus dulcis]|uniref:PREDICTED: LOC18785058 isoform n=1 Tax=Prunus dulcis TaxID=3755 RepID=A0A5E4FED3_PRUDU|nr:PREDICTED: LOC18785058 isoform [Prunus dulcis]